MSQLHEQLSKVPEPYDRFPSIAPHLIVALELMFPYVLPKPDDSERKDLYHAGREAVIDRLRKVRLYQMKGDRQT